MTKGEIELMLRKHNENKARLKALVVRYRDLAVGEVFDIAGEVLQSSMSDEKIIVQAKQMASNTERIAMRKWQLGDVSAQRISEVIDEVAHLAKRVEYIETALLSVNDRARFILIKNYVEGWALPYVCAQYEEEFKEQLTERTARRQRREGLQTIERVLQGLELVS